MTRIDIVKILIITVAIVAFDLLENIVNIRKKQRGRQILLPFAAIIYSIVGNIVFSAKYNEIKALVGGFSVLKDAEIVLINIAFILGFIIIKCIACPILSAVWKKEKLLKATLPPFYQYSDKYRDWFLSTRWEEVRKALKIASACSAALCAAILSVGCIAGSDSPYFVFIIPCTFLVCVNEMMCFLNGLTIEEYEYIIMGDSADAFRVENYNRIREVYEKILPSPILTAHTGCEFLSHRGATQLLTEMENSDDAIDRNVAKYFNSFGDENVWDVDCIQAITKMMHGHSALFFNPFYRSMEAYLTLPIVNTLMNAKKCLIVAGRNSVSEDALIWLKELLSRYSRLRTMWRVRALDHNPPECEVGILSFRQLYEIDVISANRDFFASTGFVLVLEPSVMVNTGQVGLNLIAQEATRFETSPVYCICDRYTDGLVDTMSHLLRTEITNVCAMPVPRSIYTGMSWDADGDFVRQKLFDKQTRFLGNGVELAAVAIKNQIPKVSWYGETKVPLKDVKWIAGQNHPTICRYMNLPTQQSTLYDKIDFVPSLWRSHSKNDQFVIAEDEFCNMFGMMRTFFACGSKQTFVNVLSENYLLRDYMRCNQQMFLSNPNAVPSIVPDYAKTERNTLLKLIMLMALRPVSEKEVAEELKLTGCTIDDILQTLSNLLEKHTYVSEQIFEVESVLDESSTAAQKINYFTIQREVFDRNFATSLKNAYYIVESEKSETEYIDARLFGHVGQTLLPGQFVTYDGKYYEVKMVSSVHGVVLRRASDLYTSRKYYRQIRTYCFDSLVNASVVSTRKVIDVNISVLQCDFSVRTHGYLELIDNHDLRSAKLVNFEDDPSCEQLTRIYKNKNIIRIHLPDADKKTLYTISVLLYEAFRSVFPDAWQYLAVIAAQPEEINGLLKYVNYAVEGDIGDEYLYIVEDSDLDLGLVDAINRNISKLFELITDYIDWHFEKIRESSRKDPVPPPIEIPSDEEKKKKSLLARFARAFKRLFAPKEIPEGKIDKNEEPAAETTSDEQNKGSDEQENSVSESSEITSLDPDTKEDNEPDHAFIKTETQAELSDDFELNQENGETSNSTESNNDCFNEPAVIASSVPVAIGDSEADEFGLESGEDFDGEGVPDDLDILMPIQPSRYQKECFLKFGFDEIDANLQIEEVQGYLSARGWSNNSLTKARHRTVLERSLLDLSAENQCDFCGMPLSGVCFERLLDGRTRCNDCSMSAIDHFDDFVELFRRTEAMMETVFKIMLNITIAVSVADARVIAKHSGHVFRPSTKYTERVLGFAQYKHGEYRLYMENGAPRLAAIDTCAHELTHIWQYLNWKDSQIYEVYRQDSKALTRLARDILYEGMAMWTSIQLLYTMGETQYAQQLQQIAENRNDVYGVGFCLYRDRYGLVTNGESPKYTPFSGFPPIDPEDVKILLSKG